MTDIDKEITTIDYLVARDFVNAMIPPLKPSDTVQKALDWMSELKVHQLAVVKDSEYLGMVQEDRLYDSEDFDALISNFSLQYSTIYVFDHQHFYEVINEANKNNLQVIAVIDEFKKYVGVISVNDTAKALARSYATQEQGGILVLYMRDYDYSLTEIARLVESDGVKILSSYIEPDTYDRSMIKLTLKLNRTDLSRVIATLERFDYQIIASFHESEKLNTHKERLDMLLHYLQM
ncbi:MAG: CBS domain-containing protein [Cytophagales bacterium]|nr:MAG: CBS domain-containing protein [Cytophagales bacterium]